MLDINRSAEKQIMLQHKTITVNGQGSNTVSGELWTAGYTLTTMGATFARNFIVGQSIICLRLDADRRIVWTSIWYRKAVGNAVWTSENKCCFLQICVIEKGTFCVVDCFFYCVGRRPLVDFAGLAVEAIRITIPCSGLSIAIPLYFQESWNFSTFANAISRS